MTPEPKFKQAQDQTQATARALLEDGLKALQLPLDARQIDQLLAYLTLLIKWNSVYNLTSVRQPGDMVRQHLLDSLAAAFAFADATSILDVGSGGGLPGLVLAIVYPDTPIALIDTVHKKTAFLKQVKAELELSNVTVYTSRVESLQVAVPFAVITSRAFSELANFLNWAGHLLALDGVMIALKGQYPEQEIIDLPADWTLSRTEPLLVPGLEARRHLLWLKRKTDHQPEARKTHG